MTCSGLQWIRIKGVESRRKQLMDARGRRRAKAIQRASDTGKGGCYDFAHVIVGRDIHWLEQSKIWRCEISKIANFLISFRYMYIRLIKTRAHMCMNFE